ncbi:multiple inositol polyphosphate phosphatase 1-like isoform X2 [Eriocheir sinensis]|uniref:multiple inositol polyphosphate phosphatase 1-like isoform X2 n=1 Tax=Eriocheir sinensis TaxID=95602 RepID=UPI0021C73192|nr:multiple inositol polyphosphate phosphatase 1-like isoform X2 [Eriocheir sinensis]
MAVHQGLRTRALVIWWVLASLSICLTQAEPRRHRCVAAQAWHLIRHGTRYASAGVIAAFVSELPVLQAEVVKAHRLGQGRLCAGDLSLLTRWSLEGLNTSWSSMLAPEGELELHGLATRYQAALPSLLDQNFSNDSFKFRHTATQRTEASARAYAKGLFSDDSAYLPLPLDPDPLLKFYDVCDKYLVEVEDNPAATREGRLFWAGRRVTRVLNRVSRRLGRPCSRDEVELLYDACRHYQAWQPARPSPWCVAFTPHDLQVMEDYHDLMSYYKDGYGHNINTAMACPPLKDVYQHFSDVVEGRPSPRGIFYFTHSTALLTVMSRLGLYRDAAPLTHRHMNPARQWRTSQHGTFATNLAFTLSRCAQNRWWVSVAVGERLVGLDGCAGSGCSWEEFTQVMAGSRSCDLDAVCAVTPARAPAPLPPPVSPIGGGGRRWSVGVVRFFLALISALDAFSWGSPDPEVRLANP